MVISGVRSFTFLIRYVFFRDCDLITAGELFGRSGYGVGLQKGSPWADQVTLAILDFHESKIFLIHGLISYEHLKD